MKKLLDYSLLISYLAVLFGGNLLIDSLNNYLRSTYNFSYVVLADIIILLLAIATGITLYVYNNFVRKLVPQLITLIVTCIFAVILLIFPQFSRDTLLFPIAAIFGNALIKLIKDYVLNKSANP